MKTFLGLVLAAVIALPVMHFPSKADLAAYAEAQATAQIGAQIVADNLHRMQ
jgi:hypothetical protein